MTESWFSSLSRDPLELFRGISNQPFPELHCAALKVFTVGSLFFSRCPSGTLLLQHLSTYSEPISFCPLLLGQTNEGDKCVNRWFRWKLLGAVANVWGCSGITELTPDSLPAIKQALTVLALVFPQPNFLPFPFGPGCSSDKRDCSHHISGPSCILCCCCC